MKLHIKKFGFACGSTGFLLYLGCAGTMAISGREKTIQFFNSLLHGLDVAPIIRMNVPFNEMLIGLAETFILCWLIGACIAGIYNFSMR